VKGGKREEEGKEDGNRKGWEICLLEVRTVLELTG